MDIKRSLACVFTLLVVCGSLGQPVKATPLLEQESPRAAGDELWDDLFLLGINNSTQPGNSNVSAVAVSGTNVYVGGDFDTAGNVKASNIAKWDSSTRHWNALGSGLNNRVLAIAARGDDVYVGGIFSLAGGVSAHYIAHWNDATQTWSEIGGELTHTSTAPVVNAIAIADNDDVYVGGDFEQAGGVTVNNIARWDRSTWHALGPGTGGANFTGVHAIAITGSVVYVGGDFTLAGGSPVNRVARWNGSVWSGLGAGANGSVDAVVIAGSSVYIAGVFDSVRDSSDHPVGHVAMWNGSVWNTLDGGVGDPDAVALAVGPDNKIYLGGRFHTLANGNRSANGLAKWDGSHWTSMGGSGAISGSDGVDNDVNALAFLDDQLYMGGHLEKSNEGKTMNHIGYWDISDDEWYALGNSVNAAVYATAVFGDYVYLGGSFTSAGGVKASRLARWNKRTGEWSAVGGGVTGCTGQIVGGCSPVVYALVVDGGNLYLGGNFTHAGGIPANGVARWNVQDEEWLALGGGVICAGSGCSAYVRTLDVSSGYVYAGGSFDYAGGAPGPVNNIAAWNGNGWMGFGNGTNNTVYSVVADNINKVYIGGSFSSPAEHAAVWGNGHWSTIAGGLNGNVNAMTPMTNAGMVTGGEFMNAGGVAAADHIATYSGINWAPLDAGLDGSVHALFIADDTLFAGGAFTNSGITGMNHIGRWYQNNWAALGIGTDDLVYTLTYDNGRVYAGGIFNNAGGKPSFFFGRWGLELILVYLPVTVR